MFHEQGCQGRVLIGPLPDAVHAHVLTLPGEWLEYDAPSGAIVVRHIQPTAAPCLPTIVAELVRMLATVPVELHDAVTDGDLFVHTEDSPHVVRLRVEKGGAVRITWAHPRFAGAQRQPCPIEKYMRDAKITQICEGTNQIQREEFGKILIGEHVAGHPRESHST